MSTYELLREGEWTDDHRFIHPGAVTWPDEPIPVLDEANALVGAVFNVRREGNRILGDLTLGLPDDLCLTAALHLMDKISNNDNEFEVVRGRLLSAKISDRDSYPWEVEPVTKRVLKWEVPVDDETHEISGGPVVHVACQHTADVVMVWTEESDLTLAPRTVRVFGTGHPIPKAATHIGSVVTAGGALVWHLYELPAKGAGK